MRHSPSALSVLRFWHSFCLCAVALLLFCASAQASSFRMPFSYYADGQAISTVLTNFAQTEGYNAEFTPEVKGVISGRFNEIAPDIFLKGMQNAFNVKWYILGRTIHFYNAGESKKIFLSPRIGNARQLYGVLKQSGVFSPQLPARLNQAGDVISVSGPPSYLSQIRSAAAAFESSQTEQIVMRVFPLKYAWADDQSVSSMDKTVTVPGVASILRAMVMGSSVSGSTVTQSRATVEKLGGKGLAAQGTETVQADEIKRPPLAENGVNIIADPRVNSVIVSDAAYRMPYYERVIADLDKPVELVEIHAAIVDIDTDFKRDLGISYQGSYSPSNGNGWGGGGSVSGSSVSSTGLPSAGGAIDAAGATLSTIYTHGADFFLARIRALEANNEARVLGRPSVLTVDNIQATLENTTTYYVQVEGYQAVDLYKVEAGTVLRVTPHIIRDHGETSIKLAVSVQDDQNDGSTTYTTSSGVPPIKQTKINTQAIVNAGQSLLIGGYYYEQKGQDENGVPLLKSVPVLGNLFKATSRSTKRMERLILITPRIVKLGQGNVPSQADEPSFHRSPTQPHYEPRKPAPKAGCSRSTAVESDSIYAGSERMM